MHGGELTAWIEAGEKAHAAGFHPFAVVTPDGKYAEVDGAALFVTGLPSSTFNGAIVYGDAGNLDLLTRKVAAFCESSKAPWSLSLRESPSGVGDEGMRARGFRLVDKEPAMILPSLQRTPPELPKELRIRRVRRPEEMGTFLVTMARGYGIPAGVFRKFLRPKASAALVARPRTAWFVGFTEGRAVATSFAVATESLCYTSLVTTIPEYRKRGFGEAMAWRAVLSGREYGCQAGFLRATEMGEPIYRKMGFVEVQRYRTYAPPKRGSAGKAMTLFGLLKDILWFATLGRRYSNVTWGPRDD